MPPTQTRWTYMYVSAYIERYTVYTYPCFLNFSSQPLSLHSHIQTDTQTFSHRCILQIDRLIDHPSHPLLYSYLYFTHVLREMLIITNNSYLPSFLSSLLLILRVLQIHPFIACILPLCNVNNQTKPFRTIEPTNEPSSHLIPPVFFNQQEK